MKANILLPHVQGNEYYDYVNLLRLFCPLTLSSSGKEWTSIWKSPERTGICTSPLNRKLTFSQLCLKLLYFCGFVLRCLCLLNTYIKVSYSFLNHKIDTVIDLLISWVLYSEFILLKKMCCISSPIMVTKNMTAKVRPPCPDLSSSTYYICEFSQLTYCLFLNMQNELWRVSDLPRHITSTHSMLSVCISRKCALWSQACSLFNIHKLGFVMLITGKWTKLFKMWLTYIGIKDNF